MLHVYVYSERKESKSKAHGGGGVSTPGAIMFLAIAAVTAIAALADPITDCENCISYANFGHVYCWPQQKCFSSDSAPCDESQCTSGWLGNACDCKSCCGPDAGCGAPPSCSAPGPSPGPPPCATRVAFPKGHFPTLQAQRPPQQTAVQASVRAAAVKDAPARSAAAKPWVLNYLDTAVRPKIQNLWCANATAEELLDIVQWEFAHQAIIHNGPIAKGDPTQISDDTDLFTSLTNGYMQNVCQRYVLGVEATSNFVGEGGIMTHYMGYPPFKNPNHPTLREANDRVFYMASNWDKTDAGNFAYGKATYVANSIYADKFFVAPGDTGAFAHTWPQPTPWGTMTDWLHLLQPHLDTYRYNLGSVFQRWYGGGPKLDISLFYFEVEWSGNCWLPEGLLYIIPLFSAMWGEDDGRNLQTWMKANKRPLVWANGDDSGMLVDPSVWMNVAGPELNITTDIVNKFNSLWAPGASFGDVFKAMPPELHFHLPSYVSKDACAAMESKAMVMGTNDNGKCVYWNYDSPPVMWECLNDGTCAQSLRTTGTFFSEKDCLQNCGGGKWACMQNAQIAGCAGKDATMCIPQPSGFCANLAECEKLCTT